MNDLEQLIRAISEVAGRWIDPDYPPRIEAERRLYGSSIKATPETVAFALNQQMPQLSISGLSSLVDTSASPRSQQVGVLQRARVPLGDLTEWLLVLLHGFEYVGVFQEASDAILAAFEEDVRALYPALRSSFQSRSEDFSSLSGFISIGIEAEDLDEIKMGSSIPEDIPHLFRSPTCSVAVLDGNENREEREDIAEDALLYEGAGQHNVRIIWAPEELNPDPYFESFAFFRGAFPVHERTPGSLQMKKAFLAAQDIPHAYGDGLEFLISRGAPAVLEPCHIRWVTYKAIDEAFEWARSEQERIDSIVARSKMHNQIQTTLSLVSPGRVHRTRIEESRLFSDFEAFLSSI